MMLTLGQIWTIHEETHGPRFQNAKGCSGRRRGNGPAAEAEPAHHIWTATAGKAAVAVPVGSSLQSEHLQKA